MSDHCGRAGGWSGEPHSSRSTSAALRRLRHCEDAYQQTGRPELLDEAADLARRELVAAPFTSATLAWLLLLRYDRGEGDGLLDAAVRAGERDAPDACAPFLAQVTGAALRRRCLRDGRLEDLDAAVLVGKHALRASPPGRHTPVWATRSARAVELCRSWQERYALGDDVADLDRALACLRATRAGPVASLEAQRLAAIAAGEHERYLLTGSQHLLDRAVRRYRAALGLLRPGAVVRPMLLTELGTVLQDRASERDDPADLRRAVALARTARATSSPSAPEYAFHLINLGTAFSTRFEMANNPGDRAAALHLWRRALAALPATSPYRPAFLDRLARGLIEAFEADNRREALLEAAVEAARAAWTGGAGSPSAAVFATHLADGLGRRWELRGQRGDLEEAVTAGRRALADMAPEAARRSDVAANLVPLPSTFAS